MDEIKLSATQRIIKNKFRKAHAIRLEHENEVNRAMKSLATTSSTTTTTPLQNKRGDSQEGILSHQYDLSNAEKYPSMHLVTKNYSIHSNNSNINKLNADDATISNANELCENLRMLIPSLISDAGAANGRQSINEILSQLRDLDIIE